MRLFLVRHGMAEEKTGGADAARALTPEGRAEVEEVSGAIGAALEPPVEVLTSPYLRAEQTAEVLRERLKIGARLRTVEALLPEGGWDALRKAVEDAERRGARCVVAVGHNPSISQMVADACSPGGGGRVRMVKGAAACLDIDDLRGRPAGELRWLVTPKALRGAKRG
jgi:phosphohistidine phosphatase